jgi:hypothetical protein
MSEALVVSDDSQIYTDCTIHGKHRTKNRLHDTTNRRQRQIWINRQHAKKRGVSYSYIVIYKHILLLFPRTNVL